MDRKLSGLRQAIRKLYGLDISEAERHFSTHNYAFVFPHSPFMVRVNVGATKPREEALSEVLWLDDLKAFSDTVCEPAPSKAGNLVEECEIDGDAYRISMFRTAKGEVKGSEAMGPLDIICVGDLLGRIHAAGINAISHGITYRFHRFEEGVERLLGQCAGAVAPRVYASMEAAHNEVLALPKSSKTYGLIHGDFHNQNFFMDGSNVWVFDFDNVVYGHFLYDVAECVFETWLFGGYKWPKPRRAVLKEDILPLFCQGYGFHHQLPSDTWGELELFMREHVILPVANLSCVPKEARTPAMSRYIEDFTKILMADDLLAATDEVVGRRIEEGVESGLEGAFPVSDFPQKVSEGPEVLESASGARTIQNPNFTLVLSSAGEATVRLQERLDTHNAEAVAKELLALIAQGEVRRLGVDATDLTYLASAGIRVFVRLLKELGELRLVNLTASVQEVLEVTGVADLPGLAIDRS